ncbi:MAG: hypothetical protein L0Y64_10330, partial [Myxococcaceae bacterium]|nr:hypothetical protein [Myxococcaceae bacterium]
RTGIGELPLGRRAWWARIDAAGLPPLLTRFDLSQGDLEPPPIVLRRGTPVTIRAEWPTGTSNTVRIRQEEQTLRSLTSYGGQETVLPLLPGSYRLIVVHRDAVIDERALEVGAQEVLVTLSGG